MKRTINGLALALIVVGNSFGQAIDQNRMDRDLEIAENILQTLSNVDGNTYRFSNQIESSYIPDFGVILSYPNLSSFTVVSEDIKGDVIVYGKSSRRFTTTTNEVYPTSQGTGYIYRNDDCDGCKEEIKEKLKKGQEKSEKLFKEQATTFLVDYADLIGQLKPSDKIMITTKGKSNHAFHLNGSNINSQSTGRTAEIIKSDLISYKKGNATREATIKKIKFTTSTKEEKVERDLELFGSIFSKLYSSDFSTTYYTTSSRINYERLDNFGAIFNMRVYSSTSDNGLFTIRTTGERRLSQEDRDKKINAMYPEFERSVKENVLNYGRTIKSLKPNEILMFKIRLTECKGCEMPRSIEVSVKANVLSDYGSGKIDMDKAVSSITVKKTNN